MSIFHILVWLLFGGLAGCLGEWLYPGQTGIKGWQTIALGVVGSFVGGGINFLIGWGSSPIAASGLLMSVVGAVLCLYAFSFLRKTMS